VETGLGEQVVDVCLHRGLADHQLCRDLRVAQALADQGEDLAFPGRQIDAVVIVARRGGSVPGGQGEQASLDRWRQVRRNDALPAFWSDQFGLNIKSVGMPAIADQVALTQGSFEDGPFVAAYGRAGVTVGAVAVNAPRVLAGYAALVTERAAFPPTINATDGPPRPVALDPPEGHQ
jgi:hypothetical protein